MFDNFLKKSADLVEAGEKFATATVVRCQPPTSGKPGDKAIVLADGRLWGWIGGGCAQPVVIKEALKCLAEGRPKLVRISPSANGAEEGVVDYTMTCHSGGALDIYIEPVLPKPQIVILGRSPVAQTLARLGRTIGYTVSVVAEEFSGEDFGDAAVSAQKDFSLASVKFTPQTFIVVSTQGEGDEEALEQALKSDAGYVAFVASKTKAEKVLEYLRTKGLAREKLGRLRAPAGLNIAAAAPEEIAVSVLAEIIQVRGAKSKPVAQAKAAQLLPVISTEAKDPICGMMVDMGKAKHKSEYQGKWFYFCCAGCKQKFEAEPARYAAVRP
ncbi:MAG TPA: XdhC family protein [Candidatus Angelobacter sp.]